MNPWKIGFFAMAVLCVSSLVVLVADKSAYSLPYPYQQRVTFGAYVPDTKEAYPAPLARTGEQDITFRVSAEEAGRLEKLAQRRNVRFKVTVE